MWSVHAEFNFTPLAPWLNHMHIEGICPISLRCCRPIPATAANVVVLREQHGGGGALAVGLEGNVAAGGGRMGGLQVQNVLAAAGAGGGPAVETCAQAVFVVASLLFGLFLGVFVSFLFGQAVGLLFCLRSASAFSLARRACSCLRSCSARAFSAATALAFSWAWRCSSCWRVRFWAEEASGMSVVSLVWPEAEVFCLSMEE